MIKITILEPSGCKNVISVVDLFGVRSPCSPRGVDLLEVRPVDLQLAELLLRLEVTFCHVPLAAPLSAPVAGDD